MINTVIISLAITVEYGGENRKIFARSAVLVLATRALAVRRLMAGT